MLMTLLTAVLWCVLAGSSLTWHDPQDAGFRVVQGQAYHGQLDSLTADRIYVTIGTNNISAGATDQEICEGISMVLSAVKSRRPEAETVLMGILPRRGHEARIKGLDRLLKKVAAAHEVGYKDPGKELLKGGKIDESLFTDGLHPNEEGYRLLAPYYR